jgi:hypothetical protein
MYMVMVACDMSFSNLSADAYMFLKYPRLAYFVVCFRRIGYFLFLCMTAPDRAYRLLAHTSESRREYSQDTRSNQISVRINPAHMSLSIFSTLSLVYANRRYERSKIILHYGGVADYSSDV